MSETETERTEDAQGDAEVQKTTDRLKRVSETIRSELEVLCRCARSASPDRSSAAVLCLLIFVVFLICAINRMWNADQYPNVVSWLVIGFELTGSGCLIVIFRSQPADVSVPDADRRQPWHQFLRHNIKLFGIVPFFFAIFVFNVLGLIAEFTCVDAWAACANYDIRVEHFTDMLSPITCTLYLFVELFFCVTFNAAHLFQNTLALAALAVVQATNLVVWLEALVHESFNFFYSERNGTFELLRCFNGSDGNMSDHFQQCFTHSTGEYGLLKAASPYLYPFIIEYLMLVMECVAEWFFSGADERSGGHQATSLATVETAAPSSPAGNLDHAESRTASVSNAGIANLESVLSHGTMPDERHDQAAGTVARASSSNSAGEFDAGSRRSATPSSVDDVELHAASVKRSTSLLEPVTYGATADQQEGVVSGSGAFSHSSANSSAQFDAGDHQTDENMPLLTRRRTDASPPTLTQSRAANAGYRLLPRFLVFIFLTVIANFLLLIFGVLIFVLLRHQSAYYWYRIVYWLALSLAAVVGYAACRNFPNRPMSPNGFEWFVMLTSIGPMVQSVVIIGDMPLGLPVVDSFVNILQICTQVIFYAYAKSIKFETEGDDEESQRTLLRQRSILIGVVLYFAVCNFTIWVENSFIEARRLHDIEKSKSDNFTLMYNIFNPLSLLFRFNSVPLFLIVLFDQRR